MPVARIRATCRSLVMKPFAGSIQGEWNTNYVTTFDGSPAQPILSPLSREARPRSGAPGVYEADYLTYNSAGVFWQYGAYTTTFPSADADGNTILDVLQLDRSGDTPVTGETFVDWPAGISGGTFTGQLRRSAGSPEGSYELVLSNAYAAVLYTGRYSLTYFEFEIGYARGPTNQIQFIRLLEGGELFTNLLGGSSSFTVLNQDQIELPQFSLTNRDGSSYTVQPISLTRSGNR